MAGWCETHYIDLMPHNPLGPVCTAASVQLGAAVPNWAWLEDRTVPTWAELYSDEIFPVQPKLDGVWYPVPDTPGLGVEINLDAAREISPLARRKIPHTVRPDGSVTNF